MASGPGAVTMKMRAPLSLYLSSSLDGCLFPTDNPLSVGLVSNNTTTETEESSRSFMDFTKSPKHFTSRGFSEVADGGFIDNVNAEGQLSGNAKRLTLHIFVVERVD